MSLARTKWKRGWYLCIEFKIVCKRKKYFVIIICQKLLWNNILTLIISWEFSIFLFSILLEDDIRNQKSYFNDKMPMRSMIKLLCCWQRLYRFGKTLQVSWERKCWTKQVLQDFARACNVYRLSAKIHNYSKKPN